MKEFYVSTGNFAPVLQSVINKAVEARAIDLGYLSGFTLDIGDSICFFRKNGVFSSCDNEPLVQKEKVDLETFFNYTKSDVEDDTQETRFEVGKIYRGLSKQLVLCTDDNLSNPRTFIGKFLYCEEDEDTYSLDENSIGWSKEHFKKYAIPVKIVIL